MKINLLCLIFILPLTACIPDNYKFKENPVYILKEALDSLEKRDAAQFLRISGKEALCLYANDTGLQKLSDNFPYAEDDLKLTHDLLSSTFNTPPKFTGHWSYKTERHSFEVFDKRNEKKIMDVLIDCEFGNEGEILREKDQRNERKYKIKKCRLVKIVPASFHSTVIPKKCEALKVKL